MDKYNGKICMMEVLKIYLHLFKKIINFYNIFYEKNRTI